MRAESVALACPRFVVRTRDVPAWQRLQKAGLLEAAKAFINGEVVGESHAAPIDLSHDRYRFRLHGSRVVGVGIERSCHLDLLSDEWNQFRVIVLRVVAYQ